MNISEIMSTDLVTVEPETSFKDVVQQMVRAEVSSLPVIDTTGRLAGLITEADLISKEAYAGRRRRALAVLGDVVAGHDTRWLDKAVGTVARDVMTTNVETCHPTDDVRVVARRMLEHGIKRLPVVEDGRLVGVVSRRDVLSMFDRPDDAIASEVQSLLRNPLYMPDDQHVRFSVSEGTVTLTGDVRYAWDEPIVVAAVREVAGVLDVVSELRHRERNPRVSTQPWMFGAR